MQYINGKNWNIVNGKINGKISIACIIEQYLKISPFATSWIKLNIIKNIMTEQKRENNNFKIYFSKKSTVICKFLNLNCNKVSIKYSFLILLSVFKQLEFKK